LYTVFSEKVHFGSRWSSINPTEHAAQNRVVSSILRVIEQTTEEKQSLKQDREDKDKAKHELAGVVNYKGNTAVLKQPHWRQKEAYKVKCKGLNIGQKCEVFNHVSSLSNADQNTFIWTAVHSWVSNTRHLSQTRPMLSFGSVSHLTLHPIPEHQHPLHQIQKYSPYSHGVSTN
jgi:hypothetical protein